MWYGFAQEDELWIWLRSEGEFGGPESRWFGKEWLTGCPTEFEDAFEGSAKEGEAGEIVSPR